MKLDCWHNALSKSAHFWSVIRGAPNIAKTAILSFNQGPKKIDVRSLRIAGIQNRGVELSQQDVARFFIDTNCLKRFRATDLAILLESVKRGIIHLAISEWSLEERCRQNLKFELQDPQSKANIYLDKLGFSRKDLFYFYLQTDIEIFSQYGVDIIPFSQISDTEIDGILNDPNTSFLPSDHGNDARDAAILLAGLGYAAPTELSIICDDNKLCAAFESHGFALIRIKDSDEAKAFCSGFGVSRRGIRIEKPHPDFIKQRLNEANRGDEIEKWIATYDRKTHEAFFSPVGQQDTLLADRRLEASLDQIAEEDRGARIKIMGAIHLLDPASRQQIADIANYTDLAPDVIDNNIGRLLASGFIQETMDYFLTKDEQICEAAARDLPASFIEMLYRGRA